MPQPLGGLPPRPSLRRGLLQDLPATCLESSTRCGRGGGGGGGSLVNPPLPWHLPPPPAIPQGRASSSFQGPTFPRVPSSKRSPETLFNERGLHAHARTRARTASTRLGLRYSPFCNGEKTLNNQTRDGEQGYQHTHPHPSPFPFSLPFRTPNPNLSK